MHLWWNCLPEFPEILLAASPILVPGSAPAGLGRGGVSVASQTHHPGRPKGEPGTMRTAARRRRWGVSLGPVPLISVTRGLPHPGQAPGKTAPAMPRSPCASASRLDAADGPDEANPEDGPDAAPGRRQPPLEMPRHCGATPSLSGTASGPPRAAEIMGTEPNPALRSGRGGWPGSSGRCAGTASRARAPARPRILSGRRPPCGSAGATVGRC